MGTKISFLRLDGQRADGYLAKAGRANAPGVLVIQEWWGLQDQIKGICDRLALAGYDALAPDLYEGTVVPYHDREAAAREMKSLDFVRATDEHVRGAAQYLLKSSAKVGLTGFCLGGAVAVLGACRIPEISAAVCFYGLPPTTVAKAADVKVPIQGHFAVRDDWCTLAAVEEFEAGLKAAGRSAEIYRYDADHGFANEQRNHHDRKNGELAWQRMLEFWQRHL
jgi:carboxymethylenebutenolidase